MELKKMQDVTIDSYEGVNARIYHLANRLVKGGYALVSFEDDYEAGKSCNGGHYSFWEKFTAKHGNNFKATAGSSCEMMDAYRMEDFTESELFWYLVDLMAKKPATPKYHDGASITIAGKDVVVYLYA